MSHPHAPARRAWLAALVAAFALALLPAMASAHGHGPHGHHGKSHHGKSHHGHHKRELTVMTQNLYLGSSLGPALAAETAPEFVAAVAQIYATVQYTNFPARAQAVANEIQEKDPDLIGLQEVTKWTTAGEGAPPGYDFLAILEAALAERGLHYTAASISNNAKIGPAPLVGGSCSPLPEPPFATCAVTLEDRDVILVNDDTHGLTWSNPQSGLYATQQSVESPVGPLSFDRGWASIDARLNHWPFHFVDTHLETEESPLVQEAQAAEFLAGPARGRTTIATGDFNSAADGSTTGSYALLTAPGKFRDAWDESQLGPGSSCCQVSDLIPALAPGQLNNPASTLKTRIDLILSRASARSNGHEAELIGDTPFQAEAPYWPSDHAGVVANLHLGR